jgi:hypothetical protein
MFKWGPFWLNFPIKKLMNNNSECNYKYPTCLIMIQKNYIVLYSSFNFQYLYLSIFLLGFSTKISIHVMKPWIFFSCWNVASTLVSWNQKLFKNKNVNINEIVAIVKCSILQFIQVHHYVFEQSSSNNKRHCLLTLFHYFFIT